MSEIVDGNNLMGRLGGGTAEGLVKELADVARARRKKLVVVFDGPPPAGGAKVQPLGDLTIVYAAPRTADEEIVRRIQESRDPRGLTVVTDDRALAGAVAAAGARTVGTDSYRKEGTARLPRKDARIEAQKEAPPANPREWERWFSDPKNRLS